MSANNRTLLAKADLALSDLTTDGGILQPEQAAKFIRLLIKEAKVMNMATVVPMKSFKKVIEKIRFPSRVLRAGQTATALPAADRAKPTTSKVELDVKMFKAQVDLDDETLEDSIERGELKQTIMTLMAEAISRDIDEILIQGDTASSDAFLAQFNGILKATTSNVVAAGTVALNKNILRDIIKALPAEYLRRKGDYRFLTSVDAEADYRDSLSDRMTSLGDTHTTEDRPVNYSGVPVMSIPMFPEDQGGGANCTSVIFCDPKNINLGIWRDIRIETDKNITSGITQIVATMRMDMKFAEETAVVKATGIKVT